MLPISTLKLELDLLPRCHLRLLSIRYAFADQTTVTWDACRRETYFPAAMHRGSSAVMTVPVTFNNAC